MKTSVCIIGAGPAGLMAAVHSAKSKADTTVIEANTTAGRKLLITGGGRCNLTHTGGPEDFVRAFGVGGRFLKHCLYEFSPQDVRDFFADSGLETIEDQTGCVFPVTQRAGDVRGLLLREAQTSVVRLLYDRRVERIEKGAEDFSVHCGRDIVQAKRVIIATGGLSWPQTGSTGDGYEFARLLGHTIVETRPTLVPLVTSETWCGTLAGTALDSVKISCRINSRKIRVSGAMLFTQDGIGGPAALDLSRFITDYLPNEDKPIDIAVDLLPCISETELHQQLLEKLNQYPKKKVQSIVTEFVPRRLAAVLCNQLVIEGLCGNQLRKEQRRRLVKTLKHLPLSIKTARPISEATLTRGGVRTDRINPKTMESKICPGLFFVGEVIDVDGPCGGYNLQICWSTGALAGSSAAKGL